MALVKFTAAKSLVAACALLATAILYMDTERRILEGGFLLIGQHLERQYGLSWNAVEAKFGSMADHFYNRFMIIPDVNIYEVYGLSFKAGAICRKYAAVQVVMPVKAVALTFSAGEEGRVCAYPFGPLFLERLNDFCQIGSITETEWQERVKKAGAKDESALADQYCATAQKALAGQVS